MENNNSSRGNNQKANRSKRTKRKIQNSKDVAASGVKRCRRSVPGPASRALQQFYKKQQIKVPSFLVNEETAFEYKCDESNEQKINKLEDLQKIASRFEFKQADQTDLVTPRYNNNSNSSKGNGGSSARKRGSRSSNRRNNDDGNDGVFELTSALNMKIKGLVAPKKRNRREVSNDYEDGLDTARIDLS